MTGDHTETGSGSWTYDYEEITAYTPTGESGLYLLDETSASTYHYFGWASDDYTQTTSCSTSTWHDSWDNSFTTHYNDTYDESGTKKGVRSIYWVVCEN